MTENHLQSTPQGRVLIIAGSDSSGGAGIQADIKSCAAFGAYSMTAITAVTAQNTTGVQQVDFMSPELVRAQIRSTLSDIGADVVKIGMLGTKDIIEVVAEEIEPLDAFIILDPVADDLTKAGDALLEKNVYAALMKGGHLDGKSVVDVLVSEEGANIMSGPRLHSRHTHGTGCTLASAIAANMALGASLDEAVMIARDFVFQAIRSAPEFGEGHGPLNHGLAIGEEGKGDVEPDPSNPFAALKGMH